MKYSWKGHKDSSAHLDKQSKQHRLHSNARYDLHSLKALFICFRKQRDQNLCLRYIGIWTNPLACLKRPVCKKALIGWTHLSEKRWREVNLHTSTPTGGHVQLECRGFTVFLVLKFTFAPANTDLQLQECTLLRQLFFQLQKVAI